MKNQYPFASDVLNALFPVGDCPKSIETACVRLLSDYDFPAEARGTLRNMRTLALLIAERHDAIKKLCKEHLERQEPTFDRT